MTSCPNGVLRKHKESNFSICQTRLSLISSLLPFHWLTANFNYFNNDKEKKNVIR